MPDNLPSLILMGLMVLVSLLCALRVVGRKLSPKKTVTAEVVHKQTSETFSKYKGNGKVTKYCVVFLAEGKKRSFYVHELSYHGYRVGEKGKLTYQGDRLIRFE